MSAVIESSSPGDELEHLVLDVPATTEHLRLLRLLVTSLATSHGADLDDLEDLRIATGEIGAHAVEAAGSDARLQVRVAVHEVVDGARSLDVHVVVPGRDRIDELDELSAMVLGAATEAHGIDGEPGRPAVWFVRGLSTAPSIDVTD